ncbi:splicing regulatory glutamine/lysine-rich protein 1 isoform X2 [Halyomorpha halys]|uniref:splicing regulatory glutamine/lysine-rich protein 1 isoform X2 n=1 Tax=Halyomorpha halys TaxID=286706 RepID=UPI0034D34DFA
MEIRSLDEHVEQLPEMSLAVKLAFNRVCSLIYSLKNDIGEEASSYQLQRICNDVDKVLQVKKNREAFKENRFPCFSELDTTSTTVKTKGTHNFISQSSLSGRRECLQPFNGNVSYISGKNGTVNGASFANILEENKESAAKHHQQNHGTVPVFSSKNDDLTTSFSSTFRPMIRNTSGVDNCISLGRIVEESRFEIEESDEGSGSEEQDDEENPFFVLKSWSILLQNNEILLTGIKMNEKGDILEKNFVSTKVLSRKQEDTVKTADGEYVLQGNLTDKNKIIPTEVKNQYFSKEPFPKFWRKAVKLWIELEEKKKKEEKLKKKISPQKKMKDVSARKRSISPKKKMKDDGTRKRSISPNKKMKAEVARKRSISPNKKLKDGRGRKKSISPKKKMNVEKSRKKSISPNKKMKNIESKKEGKLSAKKLKSPASSASKHEPAATGNKKTNDKSKNNSKKNKQAFNAQNLDNADLEKEDGANLNLENGQDEHGPFSELLGDDPLMIFRSSSLTPNGLLGSIKKNVIKGRYTPPTSMFDNVYGTKSDNNSSANTSFDDIGVKNNHVVKRMCKVNKKPKTKQNNKSLKHVHMMEEDEAINEILRAAKSKTNTTPSIMKQVFSADRAEDSVNFSDLSDIEVA